MPSYKINSLVSVKSRNEPGQPYREGGTGRVKKVNSDGSLDIAYILGGKETGVPSKFVTLSSVLVNEGMTTRSTPRKPRKRKISTPHPKKAKTVTARGRSKSPKPLKKRSPSPKKKATPKRSRTPSKSSAPKRSPTPSKRKTKPVAETHDDSPHYEFGGPVGAFGTMVFLPIVVYGLVFLCGPSECVGLSTLYAKLASWTAPTVDDVLGYFDLTAFLVVLGWFAFHVILERTMPCVVAEGVKLRDGSKLKYRINAHLVFWISLGCSIWVFPKIIPGFSLAYCYDNYLQLATAACVFSFALSFYLYFTSFGEDKMLALGGNTGNALYDFFIGRELNPRIGSFDLKCFCELRPGLIGWVAINIGCLMKQIELNGSASWAMILVNLFQGLYVWDALYFEKAILTTMDITTDGFGFMLAFGDLCWVPFTYTVQARYLVSHPGLVSESILVVVAALNILGYVVFRGSNGEKNSFRTDPNSPSVAHLKYMDTKRGTKLLISGWWGLARKINYTGDWLMGLAWCAFCGFDALVPYFYAIYFAVLLVHRSFRDDHACREKYGADWDTYKAKVPAVFIPGVF